ncbi:hypothetical protein CPC08DRAFT_759253 [Agrocybe pediades]|nr:hypothetical protein CPC08DRAFT_759253 [Agrocybe pediades]
MVQITTALVAAAIIVPAIAAPVIECVILPYNIDLPLPLPVLPLDEKKLKLVHQFHNPGHVNSNSINPAANVLLQGKATKSLLAHKPAVAGTGAAKDIKRIAASIIQKQPRELELDAWDPRFNFGKVLKTAGRIASNFIREDETLDLAERDLEDDELEDRRFNFGMVFKTVEKVASNFIRDVETGDNYVIREVADIDELD